MSGAFGRLRAGLAALVLLLGACASAQIRPAPLSQVTLLDARLEAAYEYLIANSPSFRAGMAGVMETGLGVTIGYGTSFPDGRYEGAFEGLAGVFPGHSLLQRAGTHTDSVHVVFFTQALEEVALRDRGVPEAEIIVDLALLLAHELFGHVAPLASSGERRWPSPCRDPQASGREVGCAVQRENRIRADLGVRQRANYAHVDLIFVCAARPGYCEDRLLRD